MKPIDLTELFKTVGDNLHTIRNARKEKLETAAEAVGVSHPVLSRLENGRYGGLSLELLVKLCNHYEVKLQQVLGLELMQVFNLSQSAENGSQSTLKQVVNDVAEGYVQALEQARSEIAFLRSFVSLPGKAQKTAAELNGPSSTKKK